MQRLNIIVNLYDKNELQVMKEFYLSALKNKHFENPYRF